MDAGDDVSNKTIAGNGKKLLVRSLDSVGTPPFDEINRKQPSGEEEEQTFGDEDTEEGDEKEEEEESESESDETLTRRRSRRRTSIISNIGFVIPSRFVLDRRFITRLTNAVQPALDLFPYRIDKEWCFFHRNEQDQFRLFFKIVKLPTRKLFPVNIWQIFAGENELIGTMKQVTKSVNHTFHLFRGNGEDVVYTFLKKLRSRKIRTYSGNVSSDVNFLLYYCLFAEDRVFVKLRDSNGLVKETMGETIVDWRKQLGILRIGKGFDVSLACISFVLSDFFVGGNLSGPEILHSRFISADRTFRPSQIKDVFEYY